MRLQTSYGALALALAGCAGQLAPSDAASADLMRDAAARDTGTPPTDAGAPLDAATPEDSGAELPDARVGADTDARTPGADARVATDAGSPGAPGCEGRSALFCEDFESITSLDDGWNVLINNGATVEVSSSLAFEGRRGLRVRLPTTAGGSVRAFPEGVFPFGGNRFFIRFYLFTTPAVDTVHTALLNVYDRELRGNYYGMHNGRGDMGFQYVTPATREIRHGGLGVRGDTRLPVDRWACVEALFDGDIGELRMWVDGVENVGAHVTPDADPPWVPGIRPGSLSLGFINFQESSAPFEVWYDAIVIDRERIGCD